MQLAEAAGRSAASKLVACGWRQTRYDEPAFTRTGEGSLVWRLGLNVAVYPQGVTFAPTLGLQHRDTMRLIERFEGDDSSSEFISAFGRGLADLLRQDGHQNVPYTRWFIADHDEIEPKTTLLRADVEKYAPPYYRCYSTVEALIDRLQRERRFPRQSQHLAVLAAMSGREELAVDALREYAGVGREEKVSTADPSRAFVEAFADHFGIGASLLD